MSTITMDFRHHYQRGERREAEQVAYQWDLGHVMNVFVPEDATYTIGYCFGDYEKTEDYAIDTKVQDPDGGYKLTAHIPNKYFERGRELRVYVVGSADDHIITTYEGFITIRGRLQPDDYVDDDPENGATQIIEVAREYATKSESFAVGGTGTREGEDTDNAKYYLEQAEAVAESIPEEYSELSDDVDQLKNALTQTQEAYVNTVDKGSLVDGIFTNGLIQSTGVVHDKVSTNRVSTFIPIKEGEQILFFGANDANHLAIAFYSSDNESTFVEGVAGITVNYVRKYTYTAESNGFVRVASCDYFTNNQFAGTEYVILQNGYADPYFLRFEIAVPSSYNTRFNKVGTKGYYHVKNTGEIAYYVNFENANQTNATEQYLYLQPNEEKMIYIPTDFAIMRFSGDGGKKAAEVYAITSHESLFNYSEMNGEIVYHYDGVISTAYQKVVKNVSLEAGWYNICVDGTVSLYVDLYNGSTKYDYFLIANGKNRRVYFKENTTRVDISGASGTYNCTIKKVAIADIVKSLNGIANQKSYWKRKREFELPFNNVTNEGVIFEDDNGYPGLGYDIIWDKTANKYRIVISQYNGEYAEVKTAVSDDLKTWSTLETTLSPTGQNTPDKGSITFPQLIQYKHMWYMFYVGFDETGFERGKHSICLARTINFTTWERLGAVLTVDNFIDDGVWDESKRNTGVIYRPRVIDVYGKYYMFINGGPDGDADVGGPNENIYVCSSDKLNTGWHVLDSVLDPSVVYPTSDYKIMADPDILFCNGLFHMAYWKGGMTYFATARMCDFPYTWEIDQNTTIEGIRPLFVPTDKKLFMLTNVSNAHAVRLYSADWRYEIDM